MIELVHEFVSSRSYKGSSEWLTFIRYTFLSSNGFFIPITNRYYNLLHDCNKTKVLASFLKFERDPRTSGKYLLNGSYILVNYVSLFIVNCKSDYNIGKEKSKNDRLT